jgi:hypothetical protein
LKVPFKELLGKRIDWPASLIGTLAAAPSAYAYAFNWHGYYAPRGLYRLLKAGIKVKVSTRPFEAGTVAGNRRFDYGAIMIPVGIQKEKADTLANLLQILAKEDGLNIFAISSGMSLNGSDLGSDAFVPLKLPKIMLVAGQGTSAGDVGEAWHLLDDRFSMDVSLVEPQSLGRADLSRYTVIAMANGTYASVDSFSTASLRRWVESGGTLITMEQASEWAVNNRFASVRFRKPEQGKRDTASTRRAYADEQRYTGAMNLDGAILEAAADRTHPLLFGYTEDRISIFKGNALFMEPPKNPYATPLLYTENPLQSGYIHKSMDPLVRNSAALVVQSLRSGRVILMTDNPNFRAVWYGTNKLFLNSIFFGSVIRLSSARADE